MLGHLRDATHNDAVVYKKRRAISNHFTYLFVRPSVYRSIVRCTAHIINCICVSLPQYLGLGPAIHLTLKWIVSLVMLAGWLTACLTDWLVALLVRLHHKRGECVLCVGWLVGLAAACIATLPTKLDLIHIVVVIVVVDDFVAVVGFDLSTFCRMCRILLLLPVLCSLLLRLGNTKLLWRMILCGGVARYSKCE